MISVENIWLKTENIWTLSYTIFFVPNTSAKVAPRWHCRRTHLGSFVISGFPLGILWMETERETQVIFCPEKELTSLNSSWALTLFPHLAEGWWRCPPHWLAVATPLCILGHSHASGRLFLNVVRNEDKENLLLCQCILLSVHFSFQLTNQC